MASDEAYTPPPDGWRTFLIVWSTQSLSVFGSALTGFAITIWLTTVAYPAPEQRAELAFALSAIGLSFGVVTMICAPFAGAWADRHDRKRTMIWADTASGLLSIVLIALLLTETLTIWPLLLIICCAAAANTFHDSAFDTSYAMLVPEQLLPRANGMMQTIWSLSGIFSPALAAGIIALPALARQGLLPDPPASWLTPLQDGAALAIAVDVATFMVAVIALLFLHIPSPRRSDLAAEAGAPKPSVMADIREGARYIWHRRSMLWLLGTFTVANFAGAPAQVLMPLLVKFNLAADWAARGFSYETALALVTSSLSLGGVAGGVLISAWGGLKSRRILGVLVPMIVAGAAQMSFGFSPWLFGAAAAGFLMSMTIPFMNAHSQTIWQTQTPRELQGRVFAVRRVIAQFTFPIGTLIAGATGGIFDPGVVIAVAGAILAFFCLVQLFNPWLRRVEDKQWLDEMAARRVGGV